MKSLPSELTFQKLVIITTNNPPYNTLDFVDLE